MEMIELPNNTDGIIFDCDGTLVNSMPLHLAAWGKAFENNGRKFEYDFIESQKGANGEKIVEAYNKHFNDNIDPEKVLADKKFFMGDSLKSVKPIQPVIDVALKYKNKLPMSVVSGGSLENVLTSLKAVGLENFFSIIITSDDKLPPKPFPDVFLIAAERMKIAPKNCLVFEDGNNGIEAAKRAGMLYIDVREIL